MDLTVLKWLDRTAVSFAEKTVFSDKENTLTFSQLNAYTKSVGTYLAKAVKPGSAVVVMSGRHVLTPACYLGVVRAGCFYAPMDATMPVARLNQILKVIKADTMLGPGARGTGRDTGLFRKCPDYGGYSGYAC